MAYAAPRGSSMQARIMALSTPEPNTGCWLWMAHVDKSGYPKITATGSSRLAHRLSYEAFMGPIPHGLTIDHKCRMPTCVNPDHLQPATNKENILTSECISARLARQTHCKRGHELSGENLYRYRGTRICRECRRQYKRSRR